MKHDLQEVAAIEQAVAEVANGLVDLNDLQLILAGGGVGEVVIA